MHWQEALGSSGTAGSVSQLLAANGISDGAITAAGLRWCIEQCLRAGRAERLALAGLKDARRAVLGGGLAILYTLVANFGIDALQPARGALRQGVIFELQERVAAAHGAVEGRDLRDDSALALQQRFDVDTAQAARVQALALRLHAALLPAAPDDDEASEATRELGWAAALHEIGMMVSHHDHHRHSAYLLGHVDAPGFSQSQQRRLAALVLGQRGGLRKVEAQLANDGFAWQLLALRLAVLLCHARQAPDADAVTIRRSGRNATLAYDAAWAAAHPRTMYLLAEEQAAWRRIEGGPQLVLPG